MENNAMCTVDLGFTDDCCPWELESYYFPSKIGGKPAWLDLEGLPAPGKLQCTKCLEPMIFLCQVYAPYEEDDNNFHRTIFVFVCRSSSCCERNDSGNFKVFRSSLRQGNLFYSSDPPDGENSEFSLAKWVKLCSLCGGVGDKHCSKCKKVFYCSRSHQLQAWKEGHQKECETGELPANGKSNKLFKEMLVDIEQEEIQERVVNEEEELEKYRTILASGNAGLVSEMSLKDLEMYASVDEDKAFSKFKKRIGHNPDQILRYKRGGQPLWIAASPLPGQVPDCEYCGGPRQFEFQIMPQLLSELKELDLDWGVLAIYTCRKSCTGGDNYKSEFVFKQDVTINDS